MIKLFTTAPTLISNLEGKAGWQRRDDNLWTDVLEEKTLDPCEWWLEPVETIRESQEFEVEAGDGSKVVSVRLPARTLILKGALEVDSDGEAFSAVREMRAWLFKSGLRLGVSASGFPSKYINISGVKSCHLGFVRGSLRRIAEITFELLCGDPAWYSMQRFGQIPGPYSSSPLVVASGGSLPVKPLFYTVVRSQDTVEIKGEGSSFKAKNNSYDIVSGPSTSPPVSPTSSNSISVSGTGYGTGPWGSPITVSGFGTGSGPWSGWGSWTINVSRPAGYALGGWHGAASVSIAGPSLGGSPVGDVVISGSRVPPGTGIYAQGFTITISTSGGSTSVRLEGGGFGGMDAFISGNISSGGASGGGITSPTGTITTVTSVYKYLLADGASGIFSFLDDPLTNLDTNIFLKSGRDFRRQNFSGVIPHLLPGVAQEISFLSSRGDTLRQGILWRERFPI